MSRENLARFCCLWVDVRLSDSAPQILVVEDQPRLLRNLTRILTEAGFVSLPAEALEAADHLMSPAIDLVLLDLMLPDGNGLEWLIRLRETFPQLPVLVLTARDAISDRVAGLDAGADDYLVKPFAFDELLARIRALLRRTARPTTQLCVGDLTVDLLSRTAMRRAQTIELQNRQIELLIFLMRHAHQVVSREMIAKHVWKEPTATWTNVIEVHVNQLRKKLEQPGCPAILHTIRGQGYLLGDVP
jgi:DNA-binding response OmpR family regulator